MGAARLFVQVLAGRPMIIRCAALILLTSLGVLAAASGSRDNAAQTYPLLHAIPPPPGASQRLALLGQSVAVDGDYTVAGAPFEDTSFPDSGVVKVFDTTTGALRFRLPNPSPQADGRFGRSVAISGTRVVVGAWQEGGPATDAGSAYVYDLAGGTPAVPVATLNNPDPAAGDGFGKAVAISGTRVVVGAPLDDTGAIDAGSAYVYDLAGVTPTVPVAVLNNPSPAAGDGFGISVAISGTRVVVGASADDTGVTNAGSAYSYDLNSGTPAAPVATLNNPSPAAYESFGWSVSISGSWVVVGSFDTEGASDVGAAYVYDVGSATPAVPVVRLNNPNPASGDYFGFSVSISGTRVVVGAPYDDEGAIDAGSVYLYDLGSATPTVPLATLNKPGPVRADDFGYSVAMAGTRVVVGVPGDDTGAYGAGSAYVYDLGGGVPTTPVAKLNNTAQASGDQFGFSVAVSGTRLVAGARYDDADGLDAGSAYVYDLGSGTPTLPVARLHNPSPTGSDWFGGAVAISGMRVVVGAGQFYAGAGRAYVYDLGSGSPTLPMAALSNPDPVWGDAFGSSVAISGARVVVGAPDDDAGSVDAGSAYVYDLSSATPAAPVATLNNPTPASVDLFGASVAISGTLVVVGAPRDNTGAPLTGSVYVYDLNSVTPTVPVVTLHNPTPASGDNFGASVAISGTRVVVGARYGGASPNDAESVYVYDLGSGTPTLPVATLNHPGRAGSYFFGLSAAISGTRVVVGAFEDDTGATDAGSAYLYDLSSVTPTVPVATVNNPGPGANDHFGQSVGIDGEIVVVGTPFDDSVLFDKGFVYVYGPPPEITVAGNGVDIADGDSTPSPGDHTDFGGVDVIGTALIRTFSVSNLGQTHLTLGAVTLSGTHAADFVVSAQPASSVAPGGSTTFQVTFDPRAHGLRVATLSSTNNDIDENPFNFVIQGTGTGTAPSRVFVATSGSDGNVCSTQTTPCRNLAAAMSQVAIDGEVIVLTPGEYDTAPILISKGIKITSPSGTVAFIRQPIIVNAPGARVALQGLTLKGNAASSAITLTAADAFSIQDTTVDGWGVGLDIANAAPSTVAISKSVFQGNQTAVRDLGPASNRVAIGGSRFEGNGTGLSASGGTHTVSECSFAANAVAISVSAGLAEISRTELWSNGTGLAVLSGGTARIGRSHVFGNTTGISAAGGSTLASFGSNVIRGNVTNVDGTVTTLPEQ